MKQHHYAAMIVASFCLAGCTTKMVAPFNDQKPPRAFTTVVDDNIKLTYIKVSNTDRRQTLSLPGETKYLLFSTGEDDGGIRRVDFTTSDIEFTDQTKSASVEFTEKKVPVSATISRTIFLRPYQQTTLRTTARDHQYRQTQAADLVLQAGPAVLYTRTSEVQSSPNSPQREYAAWTVNNKKVPPYAQNCARFLYSNYAPYEMPETPVLQGEAAYVVDILPSVEGTVRYYSLKDNCYGVKGAVMFSAADIKNGVYKPISTTNTLVDGVWVIAPVNNINPRSTPELTIRWEPKKIAP